MSVPNNMFVETRARQRTMTLLFNVTAALGLLVLGFPLTPATIKATLLGWILAVVAISRFVLGHSRIVDLCAQEFCHKEKTHG